MAVVCMIKQQRPFALKHQGAVSVDPAHRLDDVGPGLALDRQEDRPLLVEPGGNQLVLSRADRVPDHRAAGPDRHVCCTSSATASTISP